MAAYCYLLTVALACTAILQTVFTQKGSIVKDPSCGTTKGCFTKCKNNNCTFVVTWQEEDAFGVFTLVSKIQDPPAWVALGFSSDSKMGDDSVTGCAADSSGNITVFSAKNNGNTPELFQDNGVTLVRGAVTDKVLNCTFRRLKAASDDGKRFDISKPWTLLFALGTAKYSGSNGLLGIMQHRMSDRFVSDITFRLSDVIDGQTKTLKFPLIKAHGCLMVGAWIFFASIGIIVARYYKPVWVNMLFSQKVWFQVHRTCMILTFCATIAGFVIIFVEVKGWSELQGEKPYLKGHPIIGIIVMVLTILNPMMALFRPHPGTPKRSIFNWAHWFVGTVAHILGVVAIFFGTQLGKADTPDYLIYILAAYVAWQMFVELVLNVIQMYFKKRDKHEIYEMSDNGEAKVHGQPEESDTGLFLKKIILILHLLVISSLSAVVIGLLAKVKE